MEFAFCYILLYNAVKGDDAEEPRMNSKPPMTRVIQLELEAKIRSGELVEGDRLYSLRQIAAAHGVSIAVALSAMRALERRGLVVTEPGRGTFVRRFKRSEDASLRLCSWNGIFPSNSTKSLLLGGMDAGLSNGIESDQFFTDEYEDYQQYLEHLSKAAQFPEQAFDIVSIDEGLLPVMAGMGLLAPLDKLCEDAGIDLGLFPEKVLRGFSFKGKLYGLPAVFTPSFLLFNKELFDAANAEPPSDAWTWEDLYGAAERLAKISSEGHVARYGLGISFSINAYAPFVLQGGGELLDRSGSCAIASCQSVAALEFFSRLYALPGVCSHRLGSPRSELADLLSNGLLAMVIGDAADYKAVAASMPSGSWGVCRLPAGKAGSATSLAIHGWGLSASAANTKRAVKAMASLFSAPAFEAFCKPLSGFPAFMAEGQGAPPRMLELLEDAEPSLQSTSPNAFKAFHSTVSTALNHHLLLSGEKCQEFQRKINEML